MSEEIVHIRARGGPCLCGLRGDPRDWPEGHFYVGADNYPGATCSKCMEVLANSSDEQLREMGLSIC